MRSGLATVNEGSTDPVSRFKSRGFDAEELEFQLAGLPVISGKQGLKKSGRSTLDSYLISPRIEVKRGDIQDESMPVKSQCFQLLRVFRRDRL